MTYHAFKRPCDNSDDVCDVCCYGSFETFYCTNCQEVGWYWHACFPGCLPDSEPSGPFATEKEAIDDAQKH